MVRRKRRRLVVMKDVPTKFKKEEYVGNMVPRILVTSAATKDVPTMLRKEEFV